MDKMWVRLLEPMIDANSGEFYEAGQLLELTVTFAVKLINAGKAVEYVVPGGSPVQVDSIVSDSSMNPIANAAIKAYVDGKNDLYLLSEAIDNQVIPAGGRKNIVVTLVGDPNSLKQIHAFKAIDVVDATDAGAGKDYCVIQRFTTADKGRSAQIGIVNVGSVDAKIKVSVTALCKEVQ